VISFYSQSSINRDHIIQNAILFPTKRFEMSYGFVTLKLHNLVRSLEGLVVVALCAFELRKFIAIGADEKIKKLLNKWLVFLLVMVSCLYLFSNLFAFDLYFDFLGVFQRKVYTLLVLIFYSMAFLSGMLPLYFPTILYGYPRLVSITNAIKGRELSAENISDTEVGVKFGLDIVAIKQKIQDLEQEQVFLSQAFNENLFAAMLNIPLHHLSYMLHQHYDTTFVHYKNSLRINYACTQLENGFLKNSTVEALATKCGFKSRSAFSKVFKEATGMSPADYSKPL